MWGWAAQHGGDSANRMHPPVPVVGHEGKSRLSIAYPSVTHESEMRNHKPFLSLAFVTAPRSTRGSNYAPRAAPVVVLRYVPAKKAYSFLTLPNLYLGSSIELRFVKTVFPLRVTNYLNGNMCRFTGGSAEDEVYSAIRGPGDLLRPPSDLTPDTSAIVQQTPVLERQAAIERQPGQQSAGSSTRGYLPSREGLMSAAYLPARPPPMAHSCAAYSDGASLPARKFTSDELAARTPRTIKEALLGPDAKYWLPGIKKDFATLRRKKCFSKATTVRPPGPAPPAIEQRFANKYRGEEAIALEDIDAADWKPRTVSRGDKFVRGQHYSKTEAPTVIVTALKMLVAWAVQRGLLLFWWDQESAFYGNLMDHLVWVKLSPGFDPDSDEIRPLDAPPLYAQMDTAVPGAPQAALLHFESISANIILLGFIPAEADKCLFVHPTEDMATTLWVDDGMLAVPDLASAEKFLGKTGLGKDRGIKWGPLHGTEHLGVHFTVQYSEVRRVVFMSQRAFALTVLERAGMLDCNSSPTPATAGRRYTKTDCPQTDEERAHLHATIMTKKMYHTVVASLNYLVAITRDDMRFIQGKLAKYTQDPGREHMLALKHALRFLKGTTGYGIEFVWRAEDNRPRDEPMQIEAWTDSSFADDIDTGRTTLGMVVKVNGATVHAFSKLSTRVASCVNHSELEAFTELVDGANLSPVPARAPHPDQLTDGAGMIFLRAMRTLTWMRGVQAALERRDVASIVPTGVNVDNAGVLAMLDGNVIACANRHIFRALAEARERVHLDKIASPVKIGTQDNIANALTKQEPGLDESAAQLRLITGPPGVYDCSDAVGAT